MAVWSPLTTHFAVNTVDSSPRTSRVDSIGHHHTATNNKAVALSLFAPGGRTVTPNYFIADKEIWGIVPEDRRAWTSGSPVDDSRSITYEILNSTNGPNWGFSQDTLDSVARLDADISKRYGIQLRHSLPGFYEHKNLYEWFGRSYATACAGPSFNINEVISATSKIQNSSPEVPEKEEEYMSRPVCVAKSWKNSKGVTTNLVRIFGFESGVEHEFTSSDKAYIKNVALSYGCSPEVPVSYISESHFDKIGEDLEKTRKGLI